MDTEKTRVYGYGDDNIAFQGGFHGEVGCYGTDEQARGVLIVMSDGTVLEVKYCGRVPGIWEVKAPCEGKLFEGIEHCDDEDANPASDVAFFEAGIKWAHAAMEWEVVR